MSASNETVECGNKIGNDFHQCKNLAEQCHQAIYCVNSLVDHLADSSIIFTDNYLEVIMDFGKLNGDLENIGSSLLHNNTSSVQKTRQDLMAALHFSNNLIFKSYGENNWYTIFKLSSMTLLAT